MKSFPGYCEKCGGSGVALNGFDTCKACQGSGLRREHERKSLSWRISAGVLFFIIGLLLYRLAHLLFGL